ncbi:MAG: cobalt-precorrin-4/precorrin-4 C(11)-methyltransferase [Euryarchaeota archaeon]|nr:cobalt-precorrin-4/precorrin-4 C(11)-methyltransferase [Euryarchaeota archaeon]
MTDKSTRTLAKYYIVGAGCGDPGLITVKGMELLKRADVLIYAGSLVHPDLVAASSASEKYDSWGMKLEEIISVIEAGVAKGLCVVRLHSGDPALYGSIIEQIVPLRERGIEPEIVPGVSSMFGAAAALQTQLTLRGVSESVIVTRPSGKTLSDAEDQIHELSKHDATLIIFLGTDKIEQVMQSLDRPPQTPVAVVYHATWEDQKILIGTIETISQQTKEAGIVKSALIIIGNVVRGAESGYLNSYLYSGDA